MQNIVGARAAIEQAERGWNRWRAAAIVATTVAAIALAAGFWLREAAGPAERSEWVQLTQFPDSVVHPALSPDGRMVAFVRGAAIPMVPFSRGQVYVKMLPDGEPHTTDEGPAPKMSPVFSRLRLVEQRLELGPGGSAHDRAPASRFASSHARATTH